MNRKSRWDLTLMLCIAAICTLIFDFTSSARDLSAEEASLYVGGGSKCKALGAACGGTPSCVVGTTCPTETFCTDSTDAECCFYVPYIWLCSPDPDHTCDGETRRTTGPCRFTLFGAKCESTSSTQDACTGAIPQC